ncbi:MAG: BrnT family toxin [Candidatus Firestonebacteria bacterium]
MNIHEFDWDEKNENHIAKHNISTSEVEETLLFRKPFYQKTREGKYIAYAITENGRYIFIVFAIKSGGRIRIISARNMTEKEKRYYKNRKGIK